MAKIHLAFGRVLQSNALLPCWCWSLLLHSEGGGCTSFNPASEDPNYHFNINTEATFIFINETRYVGENRVKRVNLHSKPKFSQKVWIWSKMQQLLQLYSAASLWWSLGCTSFNGSHSTWAHTVEVQSCIFSVCVHLYSFIHHHSFYPPGPHPVCLFSHRSVFILRVRITTPGSKCQRSGINLASAPPRARSGEQMI